MQTIRVIPQDQCSSILTGILIGLKSNNTADLLEISIKAFQDSLLYLQDLFDEKKIIEYAIESLLQLCKFEDDGIKALTMICLNEFIRIKYLKIAFYIVPIFNVLSSHLLSTDNEIAMQAVEIWTTVANEELTRKKQSVKTFIQIENSKPDIFEFY